MLLNQQQDPLENERRFDAETLSKVTALAQELKSRQQETLTAGEIESIGAEVGLERPFIRQALSQVTSEVRKTVGPTQTGPMPIHALSGVVGAWWAAGWAIPLILKLGFGFLGSISTALFFLGWLVYIGGGIILSSILSGRQQLEARAQTPHADPQQAPGRSVSRAELLDALFAIQQALEQHKQHLAFLSVDVVGSTAMKAGAGELEVEHSFGQFRAWVEETVRAHGGKLHTAAGDGMMCIFPDDASAVRAAWDLQQGIEAFNIDRSRLPQPFRIRCGLSAGSVAMEPGVSIGHLNSPVVDRAALLQKAAEPGDIILGKELAATALVELGGVAPLPGEVGGERVFSWRRAQQAQQ
jgi:class 3 adenylate cyclase